MREQEKEFENIRKDWEKKGVGKEIKIDVWGKRHLLDKYLNIMNKYSLNVISNKKWVSTVKNPKWLKRMKELAEEWLCE